MKDERTSCLHQGNETLQNALKTVDETVDIKLTGQRHRLKQQAKEKLERAGWIDEFRILCRQHAATTFQDDPKTLTHESLVAEVGAKGKASIPDYLKAELLSEIKSILEQNTSVSPAQQSS